MEKIPTAQELAEKLFVKRPGAYSNFNRVGFTGKQLITVATELSKLHVEACKKAIKEKGQMEEYGEFGGIDHDSIDNAYPLSNIK